MDQVMSNNSHFENGQHNLFLTTLIDWGHETWEPNRLTHLQYCFCSPSKLQRLDPGIELSHAKLVFALVWIWYSCAMCLNSIEHVLHVFLAACKLPLACSYVLCGLKFRVWHRAWVAEQSLHLTNWCLTFYIFVWRISLMIDVLPNQINSTHMAHDWVWLFVCWQQYGVSAWSWRLTVRHLHMYQKYSSFLLYIHVYIINSLLAFDLYRCWFWNIINIYIYNNYKCIWYVYLVHQCYLYLDSHKSHR